MTQVLTARYAELIAGMLSCYHRLVITGTLPVVCDTDGMTRYLKANGSAFSITRSSPGHCAKGSARRLQAVARQQTHKTFIRPDSGKCLCYYFYFMDARLGLVYLRVPTHRSRTLDRGRLSFQN